MMFRRSFFWFVPLVLLPSGFAFLYALYGIVSRRRWARSLGLALSSAVVAFFLLYARSVYATVTHWLRHPEPDLTGAILVIGLTLFAANGLCLYYLTRPHVKTCLGK
jgi:hypothetical protein